MTTSFNSAVADELPTQVAAWGRQWQLTDYCVDGGCAVYVSTLDDEITVGLPYAVEAQTINGTNLDEVPRFPCIKELFAWLEQNGRASQFAEKLNRPFALSRAQ